jgi:hypothetical protein
MPQKNSFVITATHPAFGTVMFTLDAADAKAAFAVWKQVVGSTKQWIVKRNEEGTACATLAVQYVDNCYRALDISDISDI